MVENMDLGDLSEWAIVQAKKQLEAEYGSSLTIIPTGTLKYMKEMAQQEERNRIIERLCQIRVEYHGPLGLIENAGWRLYELRWHKTRLGQPVKNKHPRLALLGVYESQKEAYTAAFVEREHGGGE